MLAAAAAAATVLVHGVVTIGPTTPTCTAKTAPCTKPAAHVLVEFTRYGSTAMATTDSRGRYTVRLRPGPWKVFATQGIRCTPGTFLVRAVASQRRDFKLDTGLR